MDKKLPIKFLWGVFCHKAITDQDTGEVSLISVTPSLKIDVVRIETNDLNPKINIGRLHAVALFERLNNSTIEINENVTIEIFQSGFETRIIEGKIVIESTDNSIFVNVKLEGVFLNVSSIQDSSDYSFEIIYKIQDQQLGKIVLPVKVKFKSLDSE